MIFWAIVLGVLAIVLFLAWRRDRRHKVDISSRHVDDLQSDLATKDPNIYNNFPDGPAGGAF